MRAVVPPGLDLLDVHAGAEAPALGPEDDHPVVGHPAGGQHRVGQAEPAGHVEGVDRRVVDDHLGDAGSVLVDVMGMACSGRSEASARTAGAGPPARGTGQAQAGARATHSA